MRRQPFQYDLIINKSSFSVAIAAVIPEPCGRHLSGPHPSGPPLFRDDEKRGHSGRFVGAERSRI